MRTIIDLEVYAVKLPIKRTFNFASGNAGNVGEKATVVIVKLLDSEGCFGWGECRPVPGWNYETLDSVLSIISKVIKPFLIGRNSLDHAGFNKGIARVIGKGPAVGHPIARAAVDIAMHDLNARFFKVPLREYLGGGREKREFKLSWTLTAHSVEDLQGDWAEGKEEGFTHFNFKAAVEPETDIAIATKICEWRDEGSFIWADANQGFSLPDAKRLASVYQDLGVDVLEQPLPADQLYQMKLLRNSTNLPLAVDEATVGPAELFAYLEAGVIDYHVLKVCRTGGLWLSQQQLALSEAAGLPFIVSGLSECLMAKLAATQLSAVYDYQKPIALNGSQFLDESNLYPNKADIEKGDLVTLNDEVGLGVEPDIAFINQFKQNL